jgi:farnesyl-diphosphate farnesyltransferase
MSELTSSSRAERRDHEPQNLWRSDDDFQSDMLQGVSRTFALTIPQLPPSLCRVVSNAYLLCRIVDTIEDEPGISGIRKEYFCHQFLGVLSGANNAELFSRQLCASLSGQTAAAEHELIRNVPRVIQIARGFSAPQREALQVCVGTMAKGMAQFQLRSEKHGLQSLEDLEQYCYYVAGVVGEMLTRLFCLHSSEIAKHQDRLMQLAVSFGQGLQMTNILKDVWEDYQMGACWLPRQIFVEEGFDLRDMAKGCNQREFQCGIQRLIGIAHGHLRNALAYSALIPSHEVGIRYFCLWAIGLAVLTLRKIHSHPGYTDGNQVKIARASVKGTVAMSRLAVHHNRVLKLLFLIATLRLPLAPISTRWSPLEIDGHSLDSTV